MSTTKKLETNEKKQELVFIKNEFNTIPLKRLSNKEIDLFFYLCLRLNEKKNKSIKITFAEIKKILNYEPNDIKRLNNLIDRTNKKLVQINSLSFEFDNETRSKEKVYFPIFHEFATNETYRFVRVQVHKRFQPFLNDFQNGGFTKFDLIELVSLKNSYSKKMYPILKQFSTTGKIYLKTIEEWKDILNIPPKTEFKKINQVIIKPMIKELKKYFDDLELKTSNNGLRKISHIGFTFKPTKNSNLKNEPKLITVSENNNVMNVSFTSPSVKVISITQEEANNLSKEFDTH